MKIIQASLQQYDVDNHSSDCLELSYSSRLQIATLHNFVNTAITEMKIVEASLQLCLEYDANHHTSDSFEISHRSQLQITLLML